MTIVKIDSDYDSGCYFSEYGLEVDMPEEKRVWVESVIAEYRRAQDYMEKLYDAAYAMRYPPETIVKPVMEKEVAERKAKEAQAILDYQDYAKDKNQEALEAAWERHLKRKELVA